jgi:hypothetical protein
MTELESGPALEQVTVTLTLSGNVTSSITESGKSAAALGRMTQLVRGM